MDKFSNLNQNQRMSMTNTQLQLKDVVMRLDIFLKEGLHVSTSKRVNLGYGEELQIFCIIHFSGEAKFVSKLKDILPQLMKKSRICLPFCDSKCTEVRVSESVFWSN